MMSKVDMSIWTSVSAPCGTVSSTLLTRVPTVWRYVSWYSLRTNLRISEVLPTPPSPIRASFAFMCRTVGIGKPAAPHSERGYKQFRRACTADSLHRVPSVAQEERGDPSTGPTDRSPTTPIDRSRLDGISSCGASDARSYHVRAAPRSTCRELESARTSMPLSLKGATSSSCDFAPKGHEFPCRTGSSSG